MLIFQIFIQEKAKLQTLILIHMLLFVSLLYFNLLNVQAKSMMKMFHALFFHSQSGSAALFH